jgi:hypothetical protein
VTRVVHVDERPEELEHLLAHVDHRHRALAGTELLGTLADVDDVVVPGDRDDTVVLAGELVGADSRISPNSSIRDSRGSFQNCGSIKRCASGVMSRF